MKPVNCNSFSDDQDESGHIMQQNNDKYDPRKDMKSILENDDHWSLPALSYNETVKAIGSATPKAVTWITNSQGHCPEDAVKDAVKAMHKEENFQEIKLNPFTKGPHTKEQFESLLSNYKAEKGASIAGSPQFYLIDVTGIGALPSFAPAAAEALGKNATIVMLSERRGSPLDDVPGFRQEFHTFRVKTDPAEWIEKSRADKSLFEGAPDLRATMLNKYIDMIEADKTLLAPPLPKTDGLGFTQPTPLAHNKALKLLTECFDNPANKDGDLLYISQQLPHIVGKQIAGKFQSLIEQPGLDNENKIGPVPQQQNGMTAMANRFSKLLGDPVKVTTHTLAP